MRTIKERLDVFENWFAARFGWFFTNGMKQHRNRQ